MPLGHPLAERRVNLSSIKANKLGNPRRNGVVEPYAREAKEFLRQKLIGRQVSHGLSYFLNIVISIKASLMISSL